jgi:NAD(P)H-flavin reductase
MPSNNYGKNHVGCVEHTKNLVVVRISVHIDCVCTDGNRFFFDDVDDDVLVVVLVLTLSASEL